jgi:hypothetical protein
MELNPLRESSSHSADQEIPHFFERLFSVIIHIHKSPPHVPIPDHMTPVHTFVSSPCSFLMDYSIVLYESVFY